VDTRLSQPTRKQQFSPQSVERRSRPRSRQACHGYELAAQPGQSGRSPPRSRPVDISSRTPQLAHHERGHVHPRRELRLFASRGSARLATALLPQARASGASARCRSPLRPRRTRWAAWLAAAGTPLCFWVATSAGGELRSSKFPSRRWPPGRRRSSNRRSSSCGS